MGKPNTYDKWQFAGNEQHPVHATKTADGWDTSGVAFEDYSRMNIRIRRSSNERRLPTPVWAVNDKMLRELLVVFLEERAGTNWAGRRANAWPTCATKAELKRRLATAQGVILTKVRPEKSETLTKLCKRYVSLKDSSTVASKTDAEVAALYVELKDCSTPKWDVDAMRKEIDYMALRSLEVQIENLDTTLRITQSGGADIVAAIVYLYYRAGLDSVGVGAELGIKPPHVRTTLFRLHETWAEWHPAQAAGTVGTANKVATNANPQTDGASKGIGFVTPNMFEGLA